MTDPAADGPIEAGLLTAEGMADPYPIYDRLRRRAPVQRSDLLGGWIVTGHAEVESALRDASLSSRRSSIFVDRLPEEDRDRIRPFARSLGLWALMTDPPDHTRLRALTSRAFTPRIVERMEPAIEALVDDLLAAPLAAGRIDAIADLAYPLPVIVIAQMLGVPPEDRDLLKVHSNAIGAYVGRLDLTPGRADAAREALEAMTDYLRPIVAERRRRPREDLVSALVAAESEGDVLSEEELLATCVMLIFAGHETTTNLIGNGLLALLDRPDAAEALRRTPGGWPAAIEEFLRYDGPVQVISRIATGPASLGGESLAAGERVLLALGAANRDPERFDDPDRLVIDRAPNPHVAFGGGPHYCLGASLARLEGRVALRRLLEASSVLEAVEAEPAWRPTLALRGLERLPIALAPA